MKRPFLLKIFIANNEENSIDGGYGSDRVVRIRKGKKRLHCEEKH